ncbi:potassium channel subfamily K member 17-like [Polypterus senegalus]|nr:potassium channel subfamily K member 17-like [Polypterus senegalus]
MLSWSVFPWCRGFRIPSTVVLTLIYIVYVLAGGAIFWKLEGDVAFKYITEMESKKVEVLSKFTCIDRDSMNGLAQVIIQSYKNGISLTDNLTIQGFWRYSSSAVFAATVATTIGYGNMAPSTPDGQIFCVFFALFGIPLNMVVLNRIGKYMLSMEKKVSASVGRKINCQRTLRVAIGLLSFLAGLSFFFCVPTVLFHEYEDWTYHQAFYYSFITLSTIGFGDLVAGINPDVTYPSWYRDFMGFWIFFGLAWLAQVINFCINMLEDLSSHLKQKQAAFLERKALEETIQEQLPSDHEDNKEDAKDPKTCTQKASNTTQ